MLTTSQTTLAAAYCEDEGILCVQCMFKETGFNDRESLLFWMASEPTVSPILWYSLFGYSTAEGLYCDRCDTLLMDPYCPDCGGTLLGCNEGTGERDRDGFLLCAGCCTKLEDEDDVLGAGPEGKDTSPGSPEWRSALSDLLNQA